MRKYAEKLRHEYNKDLEKLVMLKREKRHREQTLEAKYAEVAAVRRDTMGAINNMGHQMRGILTERDAAGAMSS